MADFSGALQWLKNGYKVKRAHWGGYWFIPSTANLVDNTKPYHHVIDFNPMIVACLKDNGGYISAQLYMEDLFSEDWEVVE